MSESEAFTAIFGDAIKTMMREVLEEMKPEEPEKSKDNFYTREEVCKKLSICRATFHNWKNAGVFKECQICVIELRVLISIKPRLWTLIPRWKEYSSPGRMYLSAFMTS